MRQGIARIGVVLGSLLTGAVLLLTAGTSFAASPDLGADCGAGASIVGSDLAGKATMGDSTGTCTLTFSAPLTNAPACTAMNEATRGGASPLGTRSTTATLTIQSNSATALNSGDVVSYLCVSY